jgi:hypothetical protein
MLRDSAEDLPAFTSFPPSHCPPPKAETIA